MSSTIENLPSQGADHILIRRFHVSTGVQADLTKTFIGTTFIPELTRRGYGPIGAFQLETGAETPCFYLIIPGTVGGLINLDSELASDPKFVETADEFWSAPADCLAFHSVDSTLLKSFGSGLSHTAQAEAPPQPRFLQLRTYQSPSFRDHSLKIRMFEEGEIDLFHSLRFQPVFFGNTLIGPRMPSLTYMLRFDSLAEAEAQWAAFRKNPGWVALSSDARFAFEPLVSKITSLYLKPLRCSQI